jgi:hypothetical protein
MRDAQLSMLIVFSYFRVGQYTLIKLNEHESLLLATFNLSLNVCNMYRSQTAVDER